MKHLLATLITLSLNFFASAADVNTNYHFKEAVHNSSNVVFGKVVSQICARDENGFIYTNNTVEVSCDLKGNSRDSIVVKTLGGELEGLIHSYSHSQQYGLGGVFILFLSENEGAFYPLNEHSAISFMNETGMPYAQGLGSVFESPEELLNQFKSFGLTPCTSLPLKIISRTLKRVEPLPADSLEKIIEANTKKFNARLEYARKQKRMSTARLAATVTYDLEFDNYKYTFENNKDYVEFDILISSSTPTYYMSAAIQISYNNDAFGDKMFANGNLELTRGTAFNKPLNYNFYINEDKPNILGVNLSAYPDRSLTGLTYVTSTPQQLMHFKIRINSVVSPSIDLISGIRFEIPDFSFGEYSVTSSIGAGESEFGSVDYNGSMYDKLVGKPVVESFTPKIITGGTNSLLTIKGYNFGKSRGSDKKGNVSFRDSDVGGVTFIGGLDDADIKSWSDNEIQVIVPSHFIKSKETIRGAAGSGTFKVSNYGAIWENTSNQPLIVKYSLLNVTSSYEVRGISHKVADDFNGKRTFKITQEILDKPNLLNAIVEAVKEWNCNVGIGIELEMNGNKYALADSDFEQNVFRLGVPNKVDAIASTDNVTGICTTSVEYVTKYTDIIINKNLESRFWYRNSPIERGPNQIDITGTILHEIGHAIGLGHVNNSDLSIDHSEHLMFYSNVSFRSVTSGPYTIEGANVSLSIDRAFNFNPACPYENIGNDFLHCVVVDVEQDLLEQKLTIRPNIITNEMVYIDEKVTGFLSRVRAISISGKVFDINYIAGQQYIDLEHIPSGNYIIELVSNEHIYRSKLVKL